MPSTPLQVYSSVTYMQKLPWSFKMLGQGHSPLHVIITISVLAVAIAFLGNN